MISTEQFLAAINSDDIFLRTIALERFNQAFVRDCDVTHAAIKALDDYGWGNAFEWAHLIVECQHDERSLDWAIAQLSSPREHKITDNVKFHLFNWIRQAPVEFLTPRLENIQAIPGLAKRIYQENVLGFHDKRKELEELGPASCFERLVAHCRDIPEEMTFKEANVPLMELLIEQIVKEPEPTSCQGKVVATLTQAVEDIRNLDENDYYNGWFVGACIILAGELRLEEAVPYLIPLYKYDWDWWNEEIQKALIKVGGRRVLDEVAGGYLEQPWHARLYLNSVFEHVYAPGFGSVLVGLIDGEEDLDLKIKLAVALAAQMDDAYVAELKKMYLKNEQYSEAFTIAEYLYAQAKLTGCSHVEMDAWRSEMEGNLEGMQNPKLDRILEKYQSKKPETYVKTEAKVGRNDPCPCGSGKKYKKCCL